MIANQEFTGKSLEFWSNIKLLNQRLGYVEKGKKGILGKFITPTMAQVKEVFSEERLDSSRLISEDRWTQFGASIIGYLTYRGDVLENYVQHKLMKLEEAKALFKKVRQHNPPACPLPMNKQADNKKDYAFLTGIVNTLISVGIGEKECDFDPKELTSFTQNGFPIRTLSRRVDGAFPSVINPRAIWEIKEYYYTTTFGSRVADGVYETQLDGMELNEIRANLDLGPISHYLIVDGYFTWWVKGRSYLCRLIDIMHMGLVTEVIFGSEVEDRLPAIVSTWT